MSDDLDELYQQVILDHCKGPRNFHTLEGANRKGEGYNLNIPLPPGSGMSTSP